MLLDTQSQLDAELGLDSINSIDTVSQLASSLLFSGEWSRRRSLFGGTGGGRSLGTGTPTEIYISREPYVSRTIYD